MSSPETLLEHATWLRRLAAGLVGDRALADDLVQDTWVAAIRHAPTGEARPWLSRVLRNAARFRWRSETNRMARESAAAALAEHATPTSEELLARHELQQMLARLVGELDEPFRATILLRYAEGLAPAEIARQLEIPASTVRGRLKEGLDRLRRGLDEAHQGNRKAWLLALAPIALWPRASHAAPAAALAILAAVAAVAVIVIATRSWRNASHVQPSEIAAAPSSAPAHRTTIAIAAGWAAQEGAPERHLAGRVVRDGAPVANALVRLTSEATPAREVRTDDNGHFDFGAQSARMITLGAAWPETLGSIVHLDLRDPTVRTDNLALELLPCAARLEGKVTDANGNPIAHAQLLREDAIGTETDATGAYAFCLLPTAALVGQLDVVIRADGYGAIALGVAPAGRIHRDFTLVPEATITGTAVAGAEIWLESDDYHLGRTDERPARLATAADADGHFRIVGASGGRYRLGGAARGKTAVGMLVTAVAGGTTDVTVQMVAAAIVHGVVSANGSPVAGARVAVRPAGKWGVVVGRDDPRDEPIIAGDAISQADGTFVLDGIPAGTTSFTALPMRVVSPPVALVAGDNRVTLATQALGTIRGFVRRHGVPVPFARIDMGDKARTTLRGFNADGTGHYVAAGLEPGTYGFYADDQQRAANIEIEDSVLVGEGETRDFDIELAWSAKIRGSVVDAGGRPVAGAQVQLQNDASEDGRCATDASGAFTCARMHPGMLYRPVVFPADMSMAALPFVGGEPPEVRASVDDPPELHLVVDPRTVAIAGTVVDDLGEPVPDVHVHAVATGDRATWLPTPTTATDAAGHFQLAHLAPGDYAILAETLDHTRESRITIAAGTTDAHLVLAPPSCLMGASFDPPHKPASPIVWDDRIELVGWDVPASGALGEPVEITLVFRVRKPIAHRWDLFVHLDGNVHRQNADHEPLAGRCPMARWQPGDVLVDRFTFTPKLAETFTPKIGFFGRPAGDGPWRDLALSAVPDTMRGDNEAVVLTPVVAR